MEVVSTIYVAIANYFLDPLTLLKYMKEICLCCYPPAHLYGLMAP